MYRLNNVYSFGLSVLVLFLFVVSWSSRLGRWLQSRNCFESLVALTHREDLDFIVQVVYICHSYIAGETVLNAILFDM